METDGDEFNMKVEEEDGNIRFWKLKQNPPFLCMFDVKTYWKNKDWVLET